MIKKHFLVHLKSSFLFQDIQIFVLTFCSCRKNGLIRKIRLVLEFMTSQPSKKTIAIHILSNISRSKDNQTMKFVRLIEYNKRNIFLQNSYRKCNEAWTLVPDLFLLFKKASYEAKISGLQLKYSIFRNPSTWLAIKTNCIKS